MARAPVLFFGLELPDTIAYKRTEAFVDFNFTFLLIHYVPPKNSTGALAIAPKARR